MNLKETGCEALCDFYSSANFIRVIKSGTVKLVRKVNIYLE